MKLIMENWKKFVTEEEEENYQAASEAAADPVVHANAMLHEAVEAMYELDDAIDNGLTMARDAEVTLADLESKIVQLNQLLQGLKQA
tara:strand:+ start:1825 stop:2085 length:261 start_codon:yes stop_codon:yes gene_type:complete